MRNGLLLFLTDLSEETTASKEVIADDTVSADVTHESALDVPADETTQEEQHVRNHYMRARAIWNDSISLPFFKRHLKTLLLSKAAARCDCFFVRRVLIIFLLTY